MDCDEIGRKRGSIPWLNVIPNHWKVKRSKQLFSARKEKAREEDVQLSATQAFGVIPQEEYEKRIGRKVTRIAQHLEKRAHVEPDDFVISMRSFQGGIERSWTRGCIRSSYIILIPEERLSIEYYQYLFKSVDYINALQATATFIRDGQDLNYSNFCQVDLPLPPREEQDQIVRFLDWKVSQINRLINAKLRQVMLLQEQRQTIIGAALTNDTEGWQKSRVGRFYEIILGKMLQSVQKDTADTYEHYLCAANIKWEGVKLSPIKKMWFSSVEKSKYRLRSGDLLVTEGGDVGVSSVWGLESQNYYIQNSVHLVRGHGESNRFLFYWLYHLKDIGYIDRLCNKATIAHFTVDKLSNCPISLPPIDVQEAIASSLDSQCAKIKSTVVAIRKGIALLHEYRTRLISDIVAGKFDVRTVVVPEYEVVEESAVDELLDDGDSAEGEHYAND
jgi:type I restriction enzyme S subunit